MWCCELTACTPWSTSVCVACALCTCAVTSMHAVRWWSVAYNKEVTKFTTFYWMEVMWYEQIKSSNSVYQSSPAIQSPVIRYSPALIDHYMNITKTFSERKQAQLRWNPQKPTKLDTTLLLHHPYILCHFANNALCFLFAVMGLRVVEGSGVGGTAWVMCWRSHVVGGWNLIATEHALLCNMHLKIFLNNSDWMFLKLLWK